MEPITHFLTGACIGRAGLNRKTAYATLAAVMAAEAADLDVFWGFAGPVEGLKHHRGITHTFVGAPVVAAACVGAVWVLDRWIAPWFHELLDRWRAAGRRKKAGRQGEIGDAPDARERQPIHWGWLYLAGLIAALSHLLLDWTNNYGLRPFFPFNPRWYAGSFMFIAEPVLWGVFFLALVVPGLLALADREIGGRRVKFRGRGWAIFALSAMVLLWCWRWSERAKGLALVENMQVANDAVKRAALEPYPFNPFRWHAILETANYFQTAEVDTRTGQIDSDSRSDVIYKPADTPAIEAAKGTALGRVYLDWSSWPMVRDLGQEPAPGMSPPQLPSGRTWTTVEFSDLRFDYSFLSSRSGAGRTVLGGWVYIVDGHEDAGESMDGREQK